MNFSPNVSVILTTVPELALLIRGFWSEMREWEEYCCKNINLDDANSEDIEFVEQQSVPMLLKIFQKYTNCGAQYPQRVIDGRVDFQNPPEYDPVNDEVAHIGITGNEYSLIVRGSTPFGGVYKYKVVNTSKGLRFADERILLDGKTEIPTGL